MRTHVACVRCVHALKIDDFRRENKCFQCAHEIKCVRTHDMHTCNMCAHATVPAPPRGTDRPQWAHATASGLSRTSPGGPGGQRPPRRQFPTATGLPRPQEPTDLNRRTQQPPACHAHHEGVRSRILGSGPPPDIHSGLRRRRGSPARIPARTAHFALDS